MLSIYVKLGIVINTGNIMINKINMVLAFMEIPISVYWQGHVRGMRKKTNR